MAFPDFCSGPKIWDMLHVVKVFFCIKLFFSNQL